jgi:hypothetical protein
MSARSLQISGLAVWVAARRAEEEESASAAGDHTALMRMVSRDVTA